MKTRDRLGIDCLSVFGLPPVQYVELAAKLGCGFITVGVPVSQNPENFPAYCFKDPRVQREMKAALKDHGITVKAGEGFFFMYGMNAQHFIPHLDAMAEIGAQTINMVSLNGDLERSLDGFAVLAEMSAARGMSSSLEFVAGHVIGNVDDAVKAIRHVGRADFKLVIDMLHLARSGGTVADLANLQPDMIGSIQLCDGRHETKDYVHEAMYERMCPGAGDFALTELLAALPRDIPVGIEVPQLRLAKAGLGATERLELCVRAARKLLAKVDAVGAQQLLHEDRELCSRAG